MSKLSGVSEAYIQSNIIYVGAFLRKYLTAKSRQLFSQKGSIVDLRLGSKDICGFPATELFNCISDRNLSYDCKKWELLH